MKLPDVPLPIAHFDLNSPNILREVLKMTTPKIFGVPDPTKVRRSRSVSSKNVILTHCVIPVIYIYIYMDG